VKDSARWGWSPNAFQIRLMVVRLVVIASAMERVNQ